MMTMMMSRMTIMVMFLMMRIMLMKMIVSSHDCEWQCTLNTSAC